jgi:hypothetical protein
MITVRRGSKERTKGGKHNDEAVRKNKKKKLSQ